MYIKKLTIATIIIFFSKTVFAQPYNEKTPLHQFFKNNFDSTIIYFQWSSWNISPNYYILSKKDSNFYYYTYSSPYRRVKGYNYPGNLELKFITENLIFEKTTPDTNRYLFPIQFHYSVQRKYWSEVNSYNLWILTDKVPISKKCESLDGDEDTYYLITKSNIKLLSFYDADFFEECDSKNINRQNEIKTRNFILNIFKQK